MSVAINLVFVGLIVFVPNDLTHPTLTSAYLIKDTHHDRVLRLYGKVSIEPGASPNAPQCDIVASSLEGDRKIIECYISDDDEFAEISMHAQVVEGHPFLPTKPRRSRPRKGVVDDLKAPDWILRISGIDSRIHAIKSSTLSDNVGARVDFEWSEAESCELDGDEETPPKAKKIGFITNSLSFSPLEQPVAESILFRLHVVPGYVDVMVGNRGGGVQVIKALCTAPSCLTLEIQDAPEPTSCTAPPPCRGTHFARYYDILDKDLAPNELFLPFRLDPNDECTDDALKQALAKHDLSSPVRADDYGKCLDDNRVINPVLLGCGLTEIEPFAPDLAESLRSTAERLARDKELFTLKKLEGEVDAWLSAKNLQRDSVNDIAAVRRALLSLYRVMDPVVCPPVMAAP